MSSLRPSRILPATSTLPFACTATPCASSNPGPKSVTSRPWSANVGSRCPRGPSRIRPHSPRPLADTPPASRNVPSSWRAIARARSAPGATSTREIPSPSNVGSSRPAVVYPHRIEHRHQRHLRPPGRDDAAVGLHHDVGELLCARADVGRHPAVASEAAIEAAVGQIARHGGAARDAVRRGAGDHDAPASSDRHRARALEPASESCERRAIVREAGVERPVRPVALHHEPVRCRGGAFADDHDPAVVLDRDVERVVVGAEVGRPPCRRRRTRGRAFRRA